MVVVRVTVIVLERGRGCGIKNNDGGFVGPRVEGIMA